MDGCSVFEIRHTHISFLVHSWVLRERFVIRGILLAQVVTTPLISKPQSTEFLSKLQIRSSFKHKVGMFLVYLTLHYEDGGTRLQIAVVVFWSGLISDSLHCRWPRSRRRKRPTKNLSLKLDFYPLRLRSDFHIGHIGKTCCLEPFRIVSSTAVIRACSHLTCRAGPSDPPRSLPERVGRADWQHRDRACHPLLSWSDPLTQND